MSDGKQWYVFQSQRHQDAAFPAHVIGDLCCPAVLCVCLTAVRLSFQIFCYFFVFRAIARITALGSLSRGPRLLHAASQHLIGRDKHDTDDEGDGESTYQALAHASLFDLLRRAGTCRRERRRVLPAGPQDVSQLSPKTAHHGISHLHGRIISRRALFWHLLAAPRLKVWLQFFSKQTAACVLKTAYQLIAAMSQINTKKVFK